MVPSPSRFVVHLGRVRPVAEPLLAADDGLVVCGRGAFETIAAYRGRPFLLGEHLGRLREGAATLSLACPPDGVLVEGMALALEANGLLDAEKVRLRVTLSSPADGSESWWIEATEVPTRPGRARVVAVPWIRNERSALAGRKTVNYGENLVALDYARVRGGDEALFGNGSGEVCEGAWSNVFLRAAGRWTTPPLSSGCLPGVTRKLVLELAAGMGLPIGEEAMPMAALDSAEAAFLTSSLREIQPVASLDGRELASVAAAAEIDALRHAYRRRVDSVLGVGSHSRSPIQSA
jgi:branched-chain amino acid aminotransferase